jgi:general secretion pathway protein E
MNVLMHGTSACDDRVDSSNTARTASSADFVRLIPRSFARRHRIVSTGCAGDVEQLLASENTTASAVHNTCVRLHRPVQVSTADEPTILALIDRAYGAPAIVVDGPHDGDLVSPDDCGAAASESALARLDRDLLASEGKGPIVQLVDRLLLDAARRRASDLHIQPLADVCLVRYRVDGVLHTAMELTPSAARAAISRVKIMGLMDIAERRAPQDGRATVTIGHDADAASIDLRISTLPTSFGERAVVRLLDAQHGHWRRGLGELGMPRATEDAYLTAAGRTHGMILVVGPTGSGKTTTLYTTLRWLATEGEAGELNITTVEDPIEYSLSTAGLAISQTQVNVKKGVTFATGLRHILRQDPDVIMVGEVRDAETARIAIQSSLTGHLVFSTVHTKDAVGTVLRLVDLGIEPYLLAESLSVVLAQRLVRCVHEACGGAGCADCFETGLHGRTGLYELLRITPSLQELIVSGAARSGLTRAAAASGMRTLAEEGARLVEEGTTTAAEVRRVTTEAQA